jgi:hypothetical protein
MQGCLYFSAAGFICSWMATSLWYVSGERQASRCKIAYYEALVKQEIEFYDHN